MEDSKKSRKPKFSHCEIVKLLEAVGYRKRVVLATLQSNTTNSKKVECWNEIASAVNTSDPAGPRRDGRECKKKWTDLKSGVVRYRSDLMRTGGGEPPKILEYYETVMDIIGDQKALLNGIEDTGMGTIPFDGWGRNGAAVAANTATVSANGASHFLANSPTDTAQGVVLAEFDPAVFEDMEEGIIAGSLASEIIPASTERTNSNSVARSTPKSQKAALRKRCVPGSPDEGKLWKAYLKQATATSAMKEKLLQK
ncbi:hypothetical protein RRG08_051171 [Elysia crispata]|uniref:Myb/SANT-like DNA-binding domain-containing protein n=1 Tax=Elysia crispata TaxID=231223 RepID=A0AAE0YNG0_9GAST|nr:hypothetical protein RRG08_051171 [Elysia crispata]